MKDPELSVAGKRSICFRNLPDDLINLLYDYTKNKQLGSPEELLAGDSGIQVSNHEVRKFLMEYDRCLETGIWTYFGGGDIGPISAEIDPEDGSIWVEMPPLDKIEGKPYSGIIENFVIQTLVELKRQGIIRPIVENPKTPNNLFCQSAINCAVEELTRRGLLTPGTFESLPDNDNIRKIIEPSADRVADAVEWEVKNQGLEFIQGSSAICRTISALGNSEVLEQLIRKFVREELNSNKNSNNRTDSE